MYRNNGEFSDAKIMTLSLGASKTSHMAYDTRLHGSFINVKIASILGIRRL